MAKEKIVGLITLDSLYTVFAKLRTANYGTYIELRQGFTATSQDIFICFQKELQAHSKINMN